MKIKAKVSFSGAITMSRGSVCECNDPYVVADLLRAGYVEEVKERPGPDPEPERAEGASQSGDAKEDIEESGVIRNDIQ